MALTKKDIEKLADTFITKEEFKKEIYSFKADMKNQMYTLHDEVIKRLNDISIEQKMFIARFRRDEEKMDNHEERIVRIEKKVLV